LFLADGRHRRVCPRLHITVRADPASHSPSSFASPGSPRAFAQVHARIAAAARPLPRLREASGQSTQPSRRSSSRCSCRPIAAGWRLSCLPSRAGLLGLAIVPSFLPIIRTEPSGDVTDHRHHGHRTRTANPIGRRTGCPIVRTAGPLFSAEPER
jgi:hypothetical protein